MMGVMHLILFVLGLGTFLGLIMAITIKCFGD